MTVKKKIIAAYALDDAALDIKEQDVKKLTHLNIAFGSIQNGEILSGHLKAVHQIGGLKSCNPDLKVSLSLGSATADDFSAGSATEAGRKKIAASCAKVVKQYGLDGVDMDWEYPCCSSNFGTASPADKQNFTALCREIRAALEEMGRRDGKHFLFTIAAGGEEYYTRNTEMEKVQQYLDHVYVMTYDLRCGFHSLTGHHTNLYTAAGDLFRTSCAAAVNTFQEAGVPRDKIVIGAAAYSRKWENVSGRNNGLLQPTRTAAGYGPTYDELAEGYINQNGYIRYWDDGAKAPYLFNGSTFLSYDDVESVMHKCRYIREADFAGIFYWQYSYDRSGALLDAMHCGLNRA